MFILTVITRLISEIFGLFDLIAGSIVKVIFFLFKLWFSYLTATVSAGGILGVLAIGLLCFSIVMFLGAFYYLLKYLSIYLLIIVPGMMFLLKYIILFVLIVATYYGIKSLITNIKIKFKGETDYV